MIDDLTSRGVAEPYRMFTSRAEYRLTLRADNADLRLTPIGLKIGCVGGDRAGRFASYRASLDAAIQELSSHTVSPTGAAQFGLSVNQDGRKRTGLELLSYPDISLGDLYRIWPEIVPFDRKIAEAVEIHASYSVYVERQSADILAARREEERLLPPDFDFAGLAGLSNELKQKLSAARPWSIAQAAQIDGMTPAALSLLIAHLKRQESVKKVG